MYSIYVLCLLFSVRLRSVFNSFTRTPYFKETSPFSMSWKYLFHLFLVYWFSFLFAFLTHRNLAFLWSQICPYFCSWFLNLLRMAFAWEVSHGLNTAAANLENNTRDFWLRTTD